MEIIGSEIMTKLQQFFTRYRRECIVALIFVVFLGVFSIGYAFAAVEPVRSIMITSRNTNYETKEEGSWKIEKSAYWTKLGEAEIKFKVNTNVKHKSNYTDFIFVLDTSGSMDGEKIQVAKDNAKELINTLFSTTNLISF